MTKKIDWLFLSRPLIIFTVLVLVSVVFYLGGDEFKQQARNDFNEAKSDLQRGHSRLSNQAKEISLIKLYLDKFEQLKNEGFIGDERRLSWIESMKEANGVLKLPLFNYAIQPQEEYIRPGLKSSKKVKLLSSATTIDLGLLHEQDLFKVFKLMDDNVKSMFTIDSCEIDSKSADKELKVDRQNMTASCTIRWVSINMVEK